MTLSVDDLDFKYLNKKMCCRTCHQSVINIFKQLDSLDSVLEARSRLRKAMGVKKLSSDVETQITLLIEEMKNDY